MKIKNLYNLDYVERLTKYAHEDDAGIDLVSREPSCIYSSTSRLIPTGVAIELPLGYFGLLRPRSGIAVSYNVSMLSSGIIDQGYRGEVMVNLHNYGLNDYYVQPADRIAQLVVLPYSKVNLEWLDNLSYTGRGENGHGSTGV